MLTRSPLFRRATASAVVLALAAGGLACSTGKPRPARIKSEYVQPDVSGNTIYLTAARDEARPVDSRSYYLGQRAEARIGEPIVEVKNYTAGDRAARAVFMLALLRVTETAAGRPA